MSKPNRFNDIRGFIINPREIFSNCLSVHGHQTTARIRWVKLSKGPHKDAIRADLHDSAIRRFPSKSHYRNLRKSKVFN